MALLAELKDRLSGVVKVLRATGSEDKSNPLEAHYDLLEAMYLNAGVYSHLAELALEGAEARTDLAALRSLRNPAHTVVEFYAAKLKVKGEDAVFGEAAKSRAENLRNAIRSVEQASNWDAEGRVMARQAAWSGDLFVKVAHRERDGAPTAVYRERIDPRYVVEFDKDERGFFTYLRIDTPKIRRKESNGEEESYTRTEVWDKDAALYSVYEHVKTHGTSVSELGNAAETTVLSASAVPVEEGGFTGYDFIPVVHIKFRDIGAGRGLSAFGHAIGSVKEADRLATKLHEMLFPDEVWTLERTSGEGGADLPPIKLEAEPGSSSTWGQRGPIGNSYPRSYRTQTLLSENYTMVGKQRLVRLPSGGRLEPKIPARDFGSHAAALDAQIKETERLLPETAYSRLRELELSGRAIRYSMMDVTDRYTEAFENFAGGIVRLNQIAFTIGQVLGISGFSVEEIGEYGADGAAFEHSFTAPDPFPMSAQDTAEAEALEAQALAEFRDLGEEPYRRTLLKHGYSEEEAADVARAAAEVSTSVARSTSALFDQISPVP